MDRVIIYTYICTRTDAVHLNGGGGRGFRVCGGFGGYKDGGGGEVLSLIRKADISPAALTIFGRKSRARYAYIYTLVCVSSSRIRECVNAALPQTRDLPRPFPGDFTEPEPYNITCIRVHKSS